MEETTSNEINHYDRLVKCESIPQRKHPHPSQLPQTITILKDSNTNATVYLVGTAHFRFNDLHLFNPFLISLLVKKVKKK